MTKMQIRSMSKPSLREQMGIINDFYNLRILAYSLDCMNVPDMVRFLTLFDFDLNPENEFVNIIPEDEQSREKVRNVLDKHGFNKLELKKKPRKKRKYNYSNGNKRKKDEYGQRGRLIKCIPLNKVYAGITTRETKERIRVDMIRMTGEHIAGFNLAASIVRLLVDGSCAERDRKRAEKYIERNFNADPELFYKRVGDEIDEIKEESK